MKILIESQFALSENDKITITRKITYLNKYESRITQVNVYFKNDAGQGQNVISSEIRIQLLGNDLFVERTDKEALKAFSYAYSAIKRRVKERRSQMNNHNSPIKEINEIVNNTY